MSMSTDFTSIPLVDITGLRSGDAAERARVARELGEAARTVGFIYVTGHGIAQEKFDNLLAMAKTFFALPLEEKMKVYIGRGPQPPRRRPVLSWRPPAHPDLLRPAGRREGRDHHPDPARRPHPVRRRTRRLRGQ